MLSDQSQIWFPAWLVFSMTLAGCGVDDLLSKVDPGSGDPASAEERDAAYAARLDDAQGTRADTDRGKFFSENGQSTSVEVVISGVVGDPAKAVAYLRKKIFKAAYHDYSQDKNQAQKQTAANKEAAANQAVAESREMFGGVGGPRFVQFKYKQVKSKYHYPEVKIGPKGDGTYTFYAYPVLNVQAFAKRVDVGSVSGIDGGGRTVTIRSMLPTPIPNFEIEELKITHGVEHVVTMKISQAEGDLAAVRAYLRLKASQLDPAINLDVVGPEAIGQGTYKVTIAPVGDLDAFAGRIQFGKVTDTDKKERLVMIEAELPDPLPTLLAANQGNGSRVAFSSGDEHPQPGESELDWALRIIKADGRFKEKALNNLAIMKPDPAERERVSATLAATFSGTDFDVDPYLNAMANWNTPELAQAIINAMEKSNSRSLPKFVKALAGMKSPEATDKAAKAIEGMIEKDTPGFYLDSYLDALERLERPEVAVAALTNRIQKSSSSFGDSKAIEAITRYKTVEVCKVLASQLGHKFVGEEAASALKQMGLIAEPVAMQMLKHPAPGYRVAGANLLFQMNSPKGADAISTAIRREKFAPVEAHLKKVRRALVTKMKDASPTNSPFVKVTPDGDQPAK